MKFFVSRKSAISDADRNKDGGPTNSCDIATVARGPGYLAPDYCAGDSSPSCAIRSKSSLTCLILYSG
jgi:hypothetical protein